jgi:hypothetical protein
MIKESVIDLLKKLLALAGSPNENEANAAMAKAQSLLLKYNIDMAEVKTTTDGGAAVESTLINEIVDFDKTGTWQPILLNMLAVQNFCRVIQTNDRKLRILGRRVNVIAVETMYNWLEPQIVRMANSSGFKRADKTMYIHGVMSNLRDRLVKDLNERTTEYNCTALVTNLKTEVNAWLRSFYPITGKVSSSHCRGSNGAYNNGRADGGNVSIYGSSRQVNSGALRLSAGG